MSITQSWHSQKSRWFTKPRAPMAHTEQACMALIAKHIRETGGVPPSTREMARGLGLKSTSGVHRIIDSLVDQGRLRRIGHRARAIEIVADDEPRHVAYFTVERVDGEATLVAIPP